MTEKETSYALLLKLLDDGEKIVLGDNLSEDRERTNYVVESLSRNKVNTLLSKDCQKCDLYLKRRYFAEPIINSTSKVLFLTPYPEGDKIFLSEKEEMFFKWINLLSLDIKTFSLLPVIKCPSPSFSKERASLCKEFLDKEIGGIITDNIIILGMDLAYYYFGNIDYREYAINALKSPLTLYGRRVYLMHTPSECVSDRLCKRLNWEIIQVLEKVIS